MRNFFEKHKIKVSFVGQSFALIVCFVFVGFKVLTFTGNVDLLTDYLARGMYAGETDLILTSGRVLGSSSAPCPYNECQTGDSCPNWYNGDAGSLCCVSKCNNDSLSTNFNPTYPRVAMQKPASVRFCSNGVFVDYSDGATPYVHSKYDMVAFASLGDGSRPDGKGSDYDGQTVASEIKSYDRETIVLGKEPNISAAIGYNVYSLKDKDGVDVYNKDLFGTPLNLSTLNSQYQAAAQSRIERYNDYTASELIDFDGIFYTELRDRVFNGHDRPNQFCGLNADFDSNGVADCGYADSDGQYGVTVCNENWGQGLHHSFTEERKKLDQLFPGRPFVVVSNSGDAPTRKLTTALNGFQFEGWQFQSDWSYVFDEMQYWRENSPLPHVVLFTDQTTQGGVFIDPNDASLGIHWDYVADWKNNFSDMRYGLTTTMMSDAYYDRSFGWYQTIGLWYDEYETDIGYPISEPISLGDKCPDSAVQNWYSSYCGCVHVRFFDKGVAIVNPACRELEITNDDLKQAWQDAGLSGEMPDYYHILGGQDSSVNSGQKFDRSTLYGYAVYDKDARGDFEKKSERGDGLILTAGEAQDAVADILVGTWYNDDTSPGSDPVELLPDVSSWSTKKKGTQGENPYFTQWIEGDPDYPEGRIYHYTSGDGKKAVFRPNIGVAGKYDIYEWHGWHNRSGGDDEATNVGYRIVAGGSEVNSGTINQRDTSIYGQWNYLGTAKLPAGSNSYVEYSTDGTDGVVIADVVMFRYTGEKEDYKADFNCDGEVNIQDLGIILSFWNKTAGLDFQHGNCSEPKDLDLDISTLSAGKITIGDIAIMISCWGQNNSQNCIIED